MNFRCVLDLILLCNATGQWGLEQTPIVEQIPLSKGDHIARLGLNRGIMDERIPSMINSFQNPSLNKETTGTLSYTREALYSLRHSAGTQQLHYDTYSRIRDLGLLHLRSRRGGQHIHNRFSVGPQYKPGKRFVYTKKHSSAIPVITSHHNEPTSSIRNERPRRDNLVPILKAKNDELSVHLWNCNSLRNKTVIVYDYIIENNVNIMFLTET